MSSLPIRLSAPLGAATRAPPYIVAQAGMNITLTVKYLLPLVVNYGKLC